MTKLVRISHTRAAQTGVYVVVSSRVSPQDSHHPSVSVKQQRGQESHSLTQPTDITSEFATMSEAYERER